MAHGFEITLVVDGIKDPEDVDAHLGGVVNEGGNHIVGVVAVTHQVLPPQKHHEGGIGHQLF